MKQTIEEVADYLVQTVNELGKRAENRIIMVEGPRETGKSLLANELPTDKFFTVDEVTEVSEKWFGQYARDGKITVVFVSNEDWKDVPLSPKGVAARFKLTDKVVDAPAVITRIQGKMSKIKQNGTYMGITK